MAGLSTPKRLAIVYRPADRPRTRGECRDGVRPCPYISCRYHLATDQHEGEWRINPGMHMRIMDQLENDEPPSFPTCALDMAEQGDSTTDEIADALSIWHSNVDPALRSGLAKAREAAESIGLDLTMLADESSRIRSPR